MKKKKPNKRQKAILSLLAVVDNEGLHYGLVNYGVSDEVAVIKDNELTALLETFRNVSNELEYKISELEEEVEEFLEEY